MVLAELLGFVAASLVMVKSGDYAVKSVTAIGKNLNIGHFVVSFFLVGLVTALPEGSISAISALKGVPALGFGTLIGSVIADALLVIGLVAIVARRTVIEKALTYELWMFGLMALLFALAMDGVISRIDGAILAGGCIFFFFSLMKQNHIMDHLVHSDRKHLARQALIFMASAAVVIASANYVVKFSQNIAAYFGVPLVVMGVIFLALATSLPEMVLAIAAASKKMANIAIGELFGVIMIDGALLIGMVAIISPIAVPAAEATKLAIFVLTSLALVSYFIRSDRALTWKEGIFLVFFYILFVATELTIARPLT